MPIRLQRKRTRGYRKPPSVVCVNRGTPYGNPFVVDPDAEPGSKCGHQYWNVPTVDDAIACYRIMVEQDAVLKAKIIRNLRGKDLACFCALDQSCHADVLLEIANAEAA